MTTARKTLTATATIALMVGTALAAVPAAQAATNPSVGDLFYSYSADRADSKPIHQATIAPDKDIYVWLKADGGLKEVTFRTTNITHLERKAPWDLAGGQPEAANAHKFPVGSHNMTVKYLNDAGQSSTLFANFKAEAPSSLALLNVSASPDRSNSQPLNGAQLPAGDAYIFAALPADSAEVLFQIDGITHLERKAPWDLAGGQPEAANAYKLTEGTKVASIIVTNVEGVKWTETVRFTVGSTTPTPEPSPAPTPTPTPTPTPEPTQTPAPAPNALRTSTNPDRSDAEALNGANLTAGQHYIHADLPSGTQEVQFFLDGQAQRTERKAPWDIQGGSASAAVGVYIGAGSHTVTILVADKDGNRTRQKAYFNATASDAPTPTPTSEPTPTPTPEPEPTTPPSNGFKPSASNVGVQSGVSLKKVGSITVNTPGTVLKNLDIGGLVRINANNVTLKNVRIRTNTSACGINVAQGVHGTLIEHADIQMGTGGTFGLAGVCGVGDLAGSGGKDHGDNVTVRYSKITGHADGLKAVDYSLYEYNYIKVWRPSGSRAHTDGIQGSGRSNFTIRYNTIGESYVPGDNAAIFIQAYNGKKENNLSGIRIHNNWLNGGGYTFHSEDGKKSSGYFKDIKVWNNVFTRNYKYGVAHLDGPISGNIGTWADNGQRVPTGAIR